MTQHARGWPNLVDYRILSVSTQKNIGEKRAGTGESMLATTPRSPRLVDAIVLYFVIVALVVSFVLARSGEPLAARSL